MPRSEPSDPEAITQRPAVFRHSGLLGTVIEVRSMVEDHHGHAPSPGELDTVVIDEIERLERVFSAFDSTSEFSRWRAGDVTTPSTELADVLFLALDWQHRSDGGFNPLAGELSARWRQAEIDDRLPSKREMGELAHRIRIPRYEMIDGVPVATGDCSLMNLHAIAKGYIVDRAIERAALHLSGLDHWWLSVNAGGDLAHRGDGSLRVGIENPHRPYDNEPPLTAVQLSNAAIATSGSARRGFRVNRRWYGHVIDPRTGWPVGSIASISVIGPDAATADVVATAAGVRAPEPAVAFVEGIEGVEALIVADDQQVLPTSGWPPPDGVRPTSPA